MLSGMAKRNAAVHASEKMIPKLFRRLSLDARWPRVADTTIGDVARIYLAFGFKYYLC